MARVSVIIFPGSNCDHDVEYAFGSLLKAHISRVWHRDRDLCNPDLVVLPGGFSYGDYLRTGALAKLSPAMAAVVDFAKQGGTVLGVCNGFQILCEVGLLPGALLQNISCSFLSRFVHLRVEESQSRVSASVPVGSVITCPIAHGEGNYFAQEQVIEELEAEQRIILRYCSEQGLVEPQSRDTNPNGSVHSIAGICNRERNVFGLMPHPERAATELIGGVGGSTGLAFLKSFM